MSGYRDDLTFIHDAGFTSLAVAAAELAIELLGEPGRAPVVELGCGGGVTLAALRDAGFEVAGSDISAAQIELARARVPDAELEVASFIDVELPGGCAAILAIGEIFNYLFDQRSGERELRRTFTRAHAALAPDGLLLFDCAGPGRVPGGGPVRNFAQGEDWAILFEALERDDPPRVTRTLTSFRLGAEGWQRDHETHELRLHPPATVRAALESAGFGVEVREGYDGTRFAPGLDVYVARKGSHA